MGFREGRIGSRRRFQCCLGLDSAASGPQHVPEIRCSLPGLTGIRLDDGTEFDRGRRTNGLDRTCLEMGVGVELTCCCHL